MISPSIDGDDSTPKSDQQESSASKFSSQFQWNVSQTGFENDDNYQLNRCDLDMAPNSRDYPTKKVCGTS